MSKSLMKIVHITNDLQRLGGVQRLLVDLMTLQQNDFEFEVILTRGENEYVDELKALGVPVFHKRDLGLIGVIKRLNNAGLVHAHLFPSIYMALLTKTPTVVTEHNPHYRRRDIPFVKTLESILYRKYAAILCISEGVQKDFLSAVKVKPALTHVVHNGVNLSRFPQVPKAFPNNNKVFKLGMVGRLVAQKDIKTLINLISILDDKFELHLAGDGELRAELEEYTANIGVTQKVHFHGQIDDIPTFLNPLDLYVQSSNWEGFGLSAVEAMAAGLPCLATNVNGLNNVVDEQYLFEVGDAQYLAGLVQKFSDSPALYNQAANYAVNQANKFSIVSTAIEHTQIYKAAIGQPNSE
jgi:glycosyltransferase involved in cell wall biosynthesis